MFTVVAGVVLTTIGYAFLWGDFSDPDAILPDMQGVAVALVLVTVVGLLLGLVGYVGYSDAASIGVTLYGLVLVTGILDVFLEIPVPVAGVEIVEYGMGLLVGIVLVLTLWDRRSNTWTIE